MPDKPDHLSSGLSTRVTTWLRGHEWVVLLFMLFIVLLTYHNTLSSPFVFDDKPNILENPRIRVTTLRPAELVRVGLNSLIATRPISYLSFAINYYYHGYRVAGYHWLNIMIHYAVGVGLYYVLKLTLCLMRPGCSANQGPPEPVDGDQIEVKKRFQGENTLFWVPFLSATIWLAHPLATQSVTYIVQRMNSMAALFYIFSLFFYINARMLQISGKKGSSIESADPIKVVGTAENPVGGAHRNRMILYYGGCVISAILAIGSKEIAITLPFFILLYEWYFFQNLNATWLKRNALFFVIVFILMNLLLFLVAWDDILSRLGNDYEMFDFTPGQRVLTQFRVIFFYLGLLLFPAPWRLNLEHEFSISSSLLAPVSTLAAFAGIAGLILISIKTAKQHRLISFSILWFLGNLAIESSVIPLDMVFEHRTYLPSMFIILAMVYYLFRLMPSSLLSIAFGFLAVIVFSVWTHERNTVWFSEVSLWEDCVKKAPTSKRCQNNLGNVLIFAGDVERAVVHLKKALSIDRDFAKANGNMGLALHERGQVEDSIRYYTRAIELNSNLEEVHINLGNALLGLGRLPEGILHFEKALKINSYSSLAYRNLGLACLRQGKMKAAIFYFTQSLDIDPGDREAAINYRYSKQYITQFVHAVSVLERAMDSDPLEPRLERRVAEMQRHRLALDSVMEIYVLSLSKQPGFEAKEIDERNMGPLHQAKIKYDAIFPLFQQLAEAAVEAENRAYVVASIYALQDHPNKSIQWLKKAISMGFDDRTQLQTDSNLDNLNSLSEYRKIVDSF